MNILVFFLLVLPCISNGLPYAEKTDDYYSDDYYSSDDDYLSEHEKVVHTTPKFVSTSTNQLVNEGDRIKLPCIVDKLEGFVLMWKKGKTMVAVGSQLIHKDDNRVQLEETENGNTLVISLAEPSDAGEYICQISAYKPTELRHSVRIRVAPVIQPVPANGLLVVRQGQPATLGCDIISGNPLPEITWKRKQRKMPTGQEEMRGLSITFPSTTRHHSGQYICSADNGFGRPVNATITLDVQHAPMVEQEQTFIHARENDETEVVCTVHASPRAKVVWYKNGQEMKRENSIYMNIGNRHSIILPGITQSTYGLYTCRATNEFGSTEKTTQVSGQASPVNFKSESFGTDNSVYNLEWVAESISPITAFKLQYKEEEDDHYYEMTNEIVQGDEEGWKEFKVAPLNNGDHFYSGKHTLTQLRTATRYVARVSSKNDYGYSKFSQPFKFGTKGAEPVQQPSTGSSPAKVHLSFSVTILMLSPFFLLLRWSQNQL